MSEVSRRDFMALSGLAAGGAVWTGCAPMNNSQADSASSGEADEVVTNANVYNALENSYIQRAFPNYILLKNEKLYKGQ